MGAIPDCLHCFFKQKTAYCTRISDWSSDVCSSDRPPRKGIGEEGGAARFGRRAGIVVEQRGGPIAVGLLQRHDLCRHVLEQLFISGALRVALVQHLQHADERSEEHTSELQSLMRISYAVFCLKKQTTTTHTRL